MATIKVSIELDDATLQREIREAAAITKREFEKIDAGKEVQKKAHTAFDQIGNDARAATRKMQSDFDQFSKRGFFKTIQDNAKNAFTAIAAGARSMFSSIGSIAQTALGVFGGNLLTSGISKLTDALTGGLQKGIDYKTKMELITSALTAVTGSAEAAAKQIEKIQKLADQTPFSFPDLATAAASMQGFGFGLKETELNLRGVADAAARLSQINQTSFSDSLKSLVTVMGQIRSETTLTSENMKQLQEKGVPVFNLLAEAMKKPVAALKEDIQAGVLSGQAASEALLEMFRTSQQIVGFASRAGETFAGRMSTLEDLIEKRAGQAMTGAFNELKGTIEKTIKLLEGEGGDKLTAALSEQFAKPVALLNRALDAIQTGNIASFLKQTAEDALKEVVNQMKEGFKILAPVIADFLNTAIIQPISTTVTDLIDKTFGAILKNIETAIDKLNQFLADPSKGLKEFLNPPGGVTPGAPGPQGDQDPRTWRNLPGGVTGRVKPVAFQQVKPQTQSQINAEWERAIREGQRRDAQARGDAIDRLKEFYRQIRVETQTAGAAISNVNLPGSEGLTAPGGVTAQTNALAKHTEQTKESTEAIDENAAAMTDWRNRIIVTSKAAQDVFDFGLRASFTGMVSAVVGGSQTIAAAVGAAFGQIKARFADFVGLSVGNLLFGKPGTGTGGTGGAGGGGGGIFGGLIGGLFKGGGTTGTGGGGIGGAVSNLVTGGGGGNLFGGIGNAIKRLFGGGGSTGLPGSLPIGGLTTQAAFGLIPGIGSGTGSAIAGAGAGAAGFAGLGAALGGLAPFAGFLAGSAVGKSSLTGQILGGIGGGVLGAQAAILGGLTTFGLSNTALGLLVNPFTAIAAGALLVGAYFLGKSKQRRADEQLADSIWSDELNKTRELIAGVNSDRIDGGEALAQWAQIRQSTVSQLGQIKTKSVRESRLKNQLADLDNGVVRELREAANRQAKRKGLSGSFLPEFATGGFVPGIDRGSDSILIAARPGEVILNRSQQGALKQLAGRGVFQQIGVPGFEKGGVAPAMPPAISQSAIRINLAFEGETSDILGNIVVRGAATSSGQRAIVNVVKTGRRNGDI